MVTILVIVYQTKHIFNHGRWIDESNPGMKFERNQVKITKLANHNKCKAKSSNPFVGHLDYLLSDKPIF